MSPPAKPLGELRVLLVEDAKAMRKIEISALRKIGVEQVTEAYDGLAARDLLEQGERFDLVISDWNMPRMDGYELLRWLRASRGLEELPFLMATGQSERRQEERARAAGASGFLVKPFGPEELRQRIEEVLRGPAAQERPAEPEGPRVLDDGRVEIRVAHIQITDHLVLGMLKHLIRRGEFTPQHFTLETRCLPGWNPVRKALEEGTVDAAFVLAPIAMELFAYDTPLRLVLLAHRGGSTFVRSRKERYEAPYADFFRGKSFFIPHMLSVHHLLAHLFFRGIGLSSSMLKGADVAFEVIPPIQMPDQLAASAESAGFIVAEPLGTKTIAAGHADLQLLTGELWRAHPCCVVVLREELIQRHEQAAAELVEQLVEAGRFLTRRPDIGASVAVDFLDPNKQLGLKAAVLKNVLTEDQGIRTDDLFPRVEELDAMQHYLHDEMGIGQLIDLERFVDTTFAARACGGRRGEPSVLHVPEALRRSQELLARGPSNRGKTYKAQLELEGKYLSFELDGQLFGIDAMKIREIVGMMPVEQVPDIPNDYLGIINLRGRVIPVVDLRRTFGLAPVEYGPRACMVITEVSGVRGSHELGIVVDRVNEVLDVRSADIVDTPFFGKTMDTTHILAFVTSGDRVRLLLNLEQLLGFSGERRSATQPAAP